MITLKTEKASERRDIKEEADNSKSFWRHDVWTVTVSVARSQSLRSTEVKGTLPRRVNVGQGSAGVTLHHDSRHIIVRRNDLLGSSEV